MGISIDDETGFISSDYLEPLKPGAEAEPYLDSKCGVVYKLFAVLPKADKASVGKKISFNFSEEDECPLQVEQVDADWVDTLEKLTVLNAGGGLPTEIIGLTSTFDYILAKQPQAYAYEDFTQDFQTAIDAFCGIFPLGQGLQNVIVSHVDGEAWGLADLHTGNIMRDSAGRPVIIDALLGRISPLTQRRYPRLGHACEEAKAYRANGQRPQRVTFGADVADDEL